ncbi:MAG: phosphate signaling complex protein PhoU [Erysipelotrichaceae bacterium]|nr:phosphate signaling complex protein PhoU [Erysipelotrichaceae bacterium]
MRNRFDTQLKELNDQLIEMGNEIISSINNAINALIDKNEELAKSTMEADINVDQQQKIIENLCFNMLVRQQPVARDLRVITAAMKIVTDMERIGDHAADISEMAILMGENNDINNFPNIKQMAMETIFMLNKTMEAYIEKDLTKALVVINYDDVVDELFIKSKKDIIQLILKDPDKGEEIADLLMVIKYFERIGDHATNIAEWVIYSLKGQA